LQQPEQYRTPLQASTERSMTPIWRRKLLRQRAESHDGKANHCPAAAETADGTAVSPRRQLMHCCGRRYYLNPAD
jgi:hypothetical protein